MDNTQDHIEKYLDGELNPEEAKAFEARLANDNELKTAFEETKAARNLITAAGRMELKETFEGFEKEMKSSESSDSEQVRVIPLWAKRVMPIAAMIVVFVGVYWFMLGGTYTTESVYNKYYEVYDAPSALRDSGTETPLHWNTAVRYYNEGKYNEALRNFEKSEAEIPEYLVDFYSGICAMSKKNPDYASAVSYFLDVEKRDNDYRQQALWYRGMALLGQGEKDKAFAVFHSIVEAKSYGYRDAQKIIKLKLSE
ncbi:hypothetical protein POV27_04885 [Aureisphaera galaxeae]|uniref:hypothetical protein n=1 Tax=Aureisphaera galaxeae TaxID=1538023 RepID=UPI00234FEEFD|nr:hypothetical protein [Aureisphaera galaxeae]MDC8003373.1 hypothetical protein [Aureisphaera galaxeae]